MKFTKRLQNIGLVSMITLLIWLYAEAQSAGTQTNVLTVTLPSQINATTVVDPVRRAERFDVSVDLSGNSAQLSEIKVMAARLGDLTLPLEEGDLPPSGRGMIDMKSLLARVRISSEPGVGRTLAEMGVSITAIEPQKVEVIVDELIEKEVDVIFAPKEVQIDPASLKIDPMKVTMVLPKSKVDEYAGSPDVFKVEAVPQGQLDQITPGIKRTIEANLEIPVALKTRHTAMKTTSVDVTFIVASQTETHELGVVPVWLLAPPSELQRYQVTLDENSRVLKDAKITGPRQLIEQLKAADSKLRVVGRIELTAEDLDKSLPLPSNTKAVSHIEIQQVEQGRVLVLHSIPLNPEALALLTSDTPPPTFVSPRIKISVSNPVVKFTVTKPGETTLTP